MPPTLPSPRRTPGRRAGGPRRWTAADKAGYLAAFATSRQTTKTFCAETGVPPSTFNLWQREARAARGGRASPRRGDAPVFARVELGPAALPRGITVVVRTPDGLE